MMLIVSDIYMLIINVKMINGQKRKPKWFDIYNKKSNSEKEFYKKNY